MFSQYLGKLAAAFGKLSITRCDGAGLVVLYDHGDTVFDLSLYVGVRARHADVEKLWHVPRPSGVGREGEFSGVHELVSKIGELTLAAG